MATAITEKELIELERKYWQAMKDGDVDTALRLTDVPCIVSGPQGVGSIDAPTFKKMFKAGPRLERFEFKDGAKMATLGDDVAVLAYEVHEELTVEGQPVRIDAAECSTWVRRDGRWACAQHSEAIEGDPFGRDRRPTTGKTIGAYE
ncbi:MAG: nuclear transport factor 2 family protein [Anaeromyxobacteraceae bacterium]